MAGGIFNIQMAGKRKGKGKVVPVLLLTEHHAMKAFLEEWRYSSTHSLTSALDGSGQLHAPATLPQGKSPWYTLERRLVGHISRPIRQIPTNMRELFYGIAKQMYVTLETRAGHETECIHHLRVIKKLSTYDQH
jgi:hypothetical protein